MHRLKEKENGRRKDGFIPDAHLNTSNEKVSYVIKPGEEKDFQVCLYESKVSFIDSERFGGLIAVVIFAWLLLLGLESLVGIELNALEIAITLVISVIFAFLVSYLCRKYYHS
jgi:hypothetical protein